MSGEFPDVDIQQIVDELALFGHIAAESLQQLVSAGLIAKEGPKGETPVTPAIAEFCRLTSGLEHRWVAFAMLALMRVLLISYREEEKLMSGPVQ